MEKQPALTEREERLLAQLHMSGAECGRRARAMGEAAGLLRVALAALRKDMEEGTQWRSKVTEERIALAIEELSKPMES